MTGSRPVPPILFCLAFAFSYAVVRGTLGVNWIFNGAELWAEAFRPFEDPDYWALLGPMFIGNRNLAIGLPLFVALVLGRTRAVGLLLLCGIVIDLPDAIELFIGTLKGFAGPGTDFYMFGAWGLTLLLILCASHLLLEDKARA